MSRSSSSVTMCTYPFFLRIDMLNKTKKAQEPHLMEEILVGFPVSSLHIIPLCPLELHVANEVYKRKERAITS